MKVDAIKIVGVAGAALGIAATLLSNWSSDKKMDATISEKINEALKKES